MDFYRVTGGRKLRPKEALLRHARKCPICNHARRADIECDFLSWRSAHEIVREYELPHYSEIHRHADALNLVLRRNENARAALGSLAERAEGASAADDANVRDVRVHDCVTDGSRRAGRLREAECETAHQSPAAAPDQEYAEPTNP